MYLANVSDEMITTGESITSSISRAEKYFEDAGTDAEQLRFFWCNVARYGHVDVMEWAHRQGYSQLWYEQFHWSNFGTQVCMKAAEYGQLAALQWLRQNDCNWNSETSSAVAKGGHLSILQWARENECEWNSSTCFRAAEGGHLSVLQWARQNGCEWNSHTCYLAARGGHLSVLQWAIENSCPWDIYALNAATSCGNPDVLNYVRHHWL